MAEQMKSYVAGFMIDRGRQVALVIKNKPEWQKGKLNGIGGKIEEDEAPAIAMWREFREETGHETDFEDWHEFALLTDDVSFEVHFFVTHVVGKPPLQTMETEQIVWVDIAGVTTKNAIPNLTWLIPLALTIGDGEHARSFRVKELAA